YGRLTPALVPLVIPDPDENRVSDRHGGGTRDGEGVAGAELQRSEGEVHGGPIRLSNRYPLFLPVVPCRFEPSHRRRTPRWFTRPRSGRSPAVVTAWSRWGRLRP